MGVQISLPVSIWLTCKKIGRPRKVSDTHTTVTRRQSCTVTRHAHKVGILLGASRRHAACAATLVDAGKHRCVQRVWLAADIRALSVRVLIQAQLRLLFGLRFRRLDRCGGEQGWGWDFAVFVRAVML